jgi:hypothetical protein
MGDQNIEFIKIPISEYNQMTKRLDWLECLEAAGVDNWQGIEEAIEMFKGDYEND